jgi:aminoglycoside phosphotransferase (APT) family kinase protein
VSDLPESREPTAADAERILCAVTGDNVEQIQRFPNGLAHFVFDAILVGGQAVVARLTRPAQRADFAGAVYWHSRLKHQVPLPRLIYAEIDERVHGFPVLILERLPGVDLGDCYPRLTTEQKRSIAWRIVEIQRRAASLPAGSGFGYAHSYDDPRLRQNWRDVLTASLERSRDWIHSAGVVTDEVVDRVAGHVDRFRDYIDQVEPVCFLHDTTTKNVIIGDGRLSGIVDVDSVCFGDPLWVLALTNMAMLSSGYDREYVDAWASALDLSDEQERVLALYTAMHCVAFIGEIGQRFNKEAAPPVDPKRVSYLRSVLDDLLLQVTRQ